MSRADIEKYLRKEYAINIYSALTRIPVGVLINEKSTLAELLRNKYKKF